MTTVAGARNKGSLLSISTVINEKFLGISSVLCSG
jgi:hypothetical protein